MLLPVSPIGQNENNKKDSKRDNQHNDPAEHILVPGRMPSEQEQQADDGKKDKDDNDEHRHIVGLSSLGIPVPIPLFGL